MMPIAITVNGRKIEALVEPRTHLGDFLREHCRLTGTHLGCEHGVCGACTVLIDGEPMRSCITYAVQCDGLAVTTVEGFDGDPIMQELRAAFSREHALQCGFCTPGMLVAARDVVRRLPGADERRIRIEMSGNLCRCTGYLGIVNAVRSVIDARGSAPAAAAAPAKATSAAPLAAFVPTDTAATAAPASTVASDDARSDEPRKGWTRFEESFRIVKPPASVWQVFADIPAVTACLPGAELTEHDAHSAKGKMTVKLGPILAAFAGTAAIERNDRDMSGIIRGAGNDRGSGSRTRGEIFYRLAPEDDGRQTRVLLTVEYNLQGALAQFSRSSLAQELGRRLVGEFAANLNAHLGGAPAGKAGAPLNLGQLVWIWLRDRLRRLTS
jgi:aerobic carbon-monoxide dehydrogenase small subunit